MQTEAPEVLRVLSCSLQATRGAQETGSQFSGEEGSQDGLQGGSDAELSIERGVGADQQQAVGAPRSRPQPR